VNTTDSASILSKIITALEFYNVHYCDIIITKRWWVKKKIYPKHLLNLMSLLFRKAKIYE